LTNFYCRNANAAIICYDITNYDSFAGLQRWVDKIVKETENCCIVLVGNKLDLVEKYPEYRKVDFAEAKRYATTLNAEVMEVSAKSGHNVTEVFLKMVRSCSEQHKQMGIKYMNNRGGRGGAGKRMSLTGNRRSINFNNDNVYRRNTRQLDQNSGGGCCK
jgi:GTPase SAR1 family protein